MPPSLLEALFGRFERPSTDGEPFTKREQPAEVDCPPSDEEPYGEQPLECD